MYPQERRFPPNGRPPRPNVLKRSRYRQWGLPLAVGMVVALMAWVGLSALFSISDHEEGEIKNTVSQALPDTGSPQAVSDQTAFGRTDSTGPVVEGGRTLLVADSPMAEAALKVSPISSRLDTAGVGQYLIKAYPVRTTAPAMAATKPAAAKPESAPKPATPPKAPVATAPPAAPSTGEETPRLADQATPATGLQFTVHLASFELKANADRSLAELQAAGIPAFITRIELDGTTYYRLMAGRFGSRSEAELYGNQLVARGLTKNMGTPLAKPLYMAPAAQ